MGKQYIKISAIVAVLVFVCGFWGTPCHARPRQLYSVNWDMGIPLGKYTRFVDNYSTRGFSFNAQVFVLPQLAVGVQLGWHFHYANKEKQIFQINKGVAMSAYTYNYLEDVPIAAHVYYHIIPDCPYIQPYIGLAVGGTYIRHGILAQDLVFEEIKWGFGLTPEIGFLVPFGSTPLGLNIFVKYGVSFDKYSYNQMKLDPYQYLNVGIGLTFLVDKN